MAANREIMTAEDGYPYNIILYIESLSDTARRLAINNWQKRSTSLDKISYQQQFHTRRSTEMVQFQMLTVNSYH